MKTENEKQKAKRTNIGIDEEAQDMLFQVMMIKGKKMSYLNVIKELCQEYIKK